MAQHLSKLGLPILIRPGTLLPDPHSLSNIALLSHSFLQKTVHFLLKINYEDGRREHSNLIRSGRALP